MFVNEKPFDLVKYQVKKLTDSFMKNFLTLARKLKKKTKK